jgi:hypothetical protein
MTSRLLPLLIAIAAISLVVLLPRLQVRSRRLFLLRVLFPSWRFFENIGVTSWLQVRSRTSEGEWAEWQNALTPPRRSWTAIFHNPEGNLSFARQSAVEHLVAEAEARPDSVAATVAFAVVRRIAEESVSSGLDSPNSELQFKLVHCDAASGEIEDFLVSPVHGFAPAPEGASE